MISQLYHLVRTGGRLQAARLSRWQAAANRIVTLCRPLEGLTDDELLRQGRDIRWRAKAGIPLHSLLPEAFALVREAARRTLGYQHYPVQLMGGMALFEGGIAEMQTGEGKTLTATLPALLRALQGQGAHVVTVNDYLAKRDADIMGPVYRALGLTVGCVQDTFQDPQRKQAYAQDVTYGTAKEFGFDFLRDRLKRGADAEQDTRASLFDKGHAESGAVQRGHHFCLIDEVDSILVDEARTPLIIALNQPNDPATVTLYRWTTRIIRELKPNVDFLYEPDKRSAFLTDQGCRHVTLLHKPALLDSIDMQKIFDQVEKALVAQLGFHRDRDYVIVDEKVVIVDESTGRMMDGRKWQDGLHQAIESKEHIPITAATGQAARITVQNFFRHYTHLAGMTGTAVQVRSEFRKTFGLKTSVIPTHRPCIRQGLPPRVFKTLAHKLNVVADEIARLQAQERAVLVGTPSVEKSEMLGHLLKQLNVRHQILNARYHKEEAEIVAEAGQPGRVTIATNMAGRGTDIHLDERVRERGGLHVIATEMHTSARIDRQLIGRAARQGDPGTYQFFLSLEDELLRCLEAKRVAAIRDRAQAGPNGELSPLWMSFFRRTQRFLEKHHLKQRRELLKAERERTDLYRRMGLDPYLEMTD